MNLKEGNQQTLKVKRLHPNATIPKRAYDGDLGFDLFALGTICIQAGQTVVVPTGIACGFPEGWGAFIKARSSQGKMGLDIFGGVVDSGYTGEIGVTIHNTADPASENNIIYEKGDKIGQLVLVPLFVGSAVEVDSLDSSDRGDKGFGSTGK